jgi:hypothetical protein
MTDMETRYKNLLSTEIAGVKASYKNTGAKPKPKPPTKGGRGGGNSSGRGGGTRGDLAQLGYLPSAGTSLLDYKRGVPVARPHGGKGG